MKPSSNRYRLVALVATAALGVGGACRREPTASENLVLVTIDTLRADRLGVYGGSVATPNLDRIARAGTFARAAFSQVPLTRPSHLSLFTGRYPFEHGVRQNVAPRFESTEAPLLAEVLGERGFQTAGFVSSIVLASESGLDRGFETFSDDFGEGETAALFLDSVQKRGDVTMDEAIAWLEGRAGGEPGRFFLWVHLYDPHDPYDPPEPYRSRYPEQPYDGEVAFTDALVGRLLEALEENGLSEKTLLVVTSDHGEAFEEHGETGHGYFIYDTTLHVPLILRGPGIEPGAAMATPVETVDLFPTVLELLGLAPAGEVSGRSFARALFDGDEPNPKPLYAESLMASLLYGWGELVSIRDDGWKLIDAPRAELYRIDEDASERDDRAERNHGARDRLKRRLEEITAASNDGATPSGGAVAEIDPELMEKLGALGYVGSTRTGAASGSDIDPKDKLSEFRFLNENMREGLRLLERKSYEEAITRFRAVLQSGTESFQALYYTGRALHALGRFQEAVTSFEGALSLDPGYIPAYLDLAETHFALGQEGAAIAVLHRGQKALPRGTSLYEREGEYWTLVRKPEQAARAFEAVLERVPDDALSHVRLGEQYRDLGRTEDALEHLREAVRLTPDAASYWNSLGMVLGGSGRMEEAADAFQHALALDGSDAQYAFNLGLAFSRLGQTDRAREGFERALEIDPRFEPARAELLRLGSR